MGLSSLNPNYTTPAQPTYTQPAAPVQPAYTKYSNSDIANYLAANSIDVGNANQVAAAIKATNADPKAVSDFIANNYVSNTENLAGGGFMNTHYRYGGDAHMQPRYLQGPTDGMADDVPSSIDGIQPAKLSHGEFVIPADVVSHLGNGNSDAGANKLYQMMDKIRMARTGTKKQGKEINPDKFTLGGKTYNTGGQVAFSSGGVPGFAGATGSAVDLTTSPLGYSSVSELSPYVGDYVTGMLGKAQALADAPMTVYKGELAAGPSNLQTQQYAGLSALAQTGAPPIKFTNTFSAPAYDALEAKNLYVPPEYKYNDITNQYKTPDAYKAANITNTYESPTAYNPINVTTGSFGTDSAIKYMNPYIQASLNPQLQALKRQQDINTQGDLSKLTAQGAYGGSRQAVLEGANNYNLLTNQSNLLGQGYKEAYNLAQNMFTSDQARQLQAQQANVQQAQFAASQGMTDAQLMAQYGMTAQQANEASRQFGATQAANAAQNNAQYGMAAANANIGQQQFGANLGMTAADKTAQYGAQAQAANIAQREFANQQAQAAAIQKAQFDAQAQAAQQAANMQSANFGLSTLAALGAAGTQQQATQQAKDTASLNQFNQQQQNPYAQLQFEQSMLQNLPIATQTVIPNTTSLGQTTKTISDLSQLYSLLNPSSTSSGSTSTTSAGVTK